MFTALSLILLFAGINAQVFKSSDRWAEFKDGVYTVRNHVWGDGAGTQELHANSYHDWSIHADHPNTGGVKSYPHVSTMVNKKLSALKSVTSTFSVAVPNAGAYTTTYDVWADNQKYEIMLWMNKQGPVGPIGGGAIAKATVGGYTWDVSKGSNGYNEVFSFINTGSTNSGSVDILAIMKWVQTQGWFGDVTLGEVAFGFEITSSAGGMDFSVKGYSVNSS